METLTQDKPKFAGRKLGSKNKPKSPIFAFQNADARAYFVKTQIPNTAQYTVYSEKSLFNPNVEWFYLKLNLIS